MQLFCVAGALVEGFRGHVEEITGTRSQRCCAGVDANKL